MKLSDAITCYLGQHKCGENEQYLVCGSACEPTCQSLRSKQKECAENCVNRCFCRLGYVRDRHNKCIPKDKC
ncbi:unnamed protein product [Soboliphyme baturini]|uniref:TIL domain-containing protein n=1 Tax=Soboliphyme baturini TaxID=241478 RepID=A0A183IZF7_9BILA|nr:unnamed protein product [Soboliphyme baturini]